MDEKLKQALDQAKYKPDPNCSLCKGTGIKSCKVDEDSNIHWFKIGQMPCACLSLGNMSDELRRELVKGVAASVKKLSEDDKAIEQMAGVVGTLFAMRDAAKKLKEEK